MWIWLSLVSKLQALLVILRGNTFLLLDGTVLLSITWGRSHIITPLLLLTLFVVVEEDEEEVSTGRNGSLSNTSSSCWWIFFTRIIGLPLSPNAIVADGGVSGVGKDGYGYIIISSSWRPVQPESLVYVILDLIGLLLLRLAEKEAAPPSLRYFVAALYDVPPWGRLDAWGGDGGPLSELNAEICQSSCARVCILPLMLRWPDMGLTHILPQQGDDDREGGEWRPPSLTWCLPEWHIYFFFTDRRRWWQGGSDSDLDRGRLPRWWWLDNGEIFFSVTFVGLSLTLFVFEKAAVAVSDAFLHWPVEKWTCASEYERLRRPLLRLILVVCCRCGEWLEEWNSADLSVESVMFSGCSGLVWILRLSLTGSILCDGKVW